MAGDDKVAARPWACPGFTRFWAASSVSSLGTYFTTVAVQLLVVVTLHQGSFSVGLVTGARWLPYLIFGLVARVLVDRSAHRPLLALTDLAQTSGPTLQTVGLDAFGLGLILSVGGTLACSPFRHARLGADPATG